MTRVHALLWNSAPQLVVPNFSGNDWAVNASILDKTGAGQERCAASTDTFLEPKRTMQRQPISRRTLLRGAAGAAIGLPMLDAMLPAPALISSANANIARSAAPTPVRMAFLYVPNGMHMRDWKPPDQASEIFGWVRS